MSRLTLNDVLLSFAQFEREVIGERVRDKIAASIRVGRKRIARLMSQSGLAGVSRRKFVTTTVKDGGRQAPDPGGAQLRGRQA